MAGANAARALPEEAEAGETDTFLVHPYEGKFPRLDVLDVVVSRTGVLGVLDERSGVITFRARALQAQLVRHVLMDEVGIREAA